MKFKKTILIWLFLNILCTSFAQTVTIKDAETRQAMQLVTLVSENPKMYVTTNAEGQVDVSLLKGAEKIEIYALGYTVVAMSYTELEAKGFELLLEPSSINVEGLVISATRWKQNSGNVPSKITSISPQEVAFQNPQTAADLLGISGKVYIQKSQQGGGSPMIRGFATNRLLYTVDGVRMNTAIFRSGNIQNVINIDPYTIESTEVLFGPGSVIYGSDAIGGVMSFQTLMPQFSIEEDRPLISGKALSRYASANQEKSGHFDVNVGWEKWAIVSSFSVWDFEHLRQGSQGSDDYLKPFYVQRQDSVDVVITQSNPLLQIPSAYSQMNLMQKLRFKPNEHWDFQYAFHYSETSLYGRYDRHIRMRNGTARYAEWNYGPQKWMMNHLNITQQGKYVVYDKMSLRIAQQAFLESRIDRSLNKDERNTQTEKVAAYAANLDFTKSIGKKNDLFYGLEYIYNKVKSEGLLTDIASGESLIGPSRYPQAIWNSMAVYINDVFNINDKLSVQGGLRYSQFMVNADFTNNLKFYPFPFVKADINKGSLTGSLGAVYRPAKSWVISTNLGTAFRAPNVDDLGKIFDSEPGTVLIPNPDLKAEYAYNADLSVAKTFGNVVKVDLTGYYTILQNAMVRRNYQLNGLDSIDYDGELSRVQAIQNAAAAYVYGIQAGLEIKIPAGFSFSSDFNYQFGEEELDDASKSSLRHAAPLFGVSRLNFKAKKLQLQFYACYQGERKFEDLAQEEQAKDEIYAKDKDGHNYAPAWCTLNFKALYRFTDIFMATAGMENLTDVRYRPYSSGISAPGRNFILSFSAHF